MTPTVEDALHTNGDAEDTAVEEHDPAVAAVVVVFDQHVHAVQPAVSIADAEQQQPPRHILDAQSGEIAHASPGEKVRHEPLCSSQPAQPNRAAA